MRRRSATPAVLAVVLLVAGQLMALAHEAESRHVICEQHGEQLEAAKLVEPLHACDHDHWVGVEGDHGGDHEECAMARTLRQASATPDPTVSPSPALATEQLIETFHLEQVATATLYLIAPKTSPPVV